MVVPLSFSSLLVCKYPKLACRMEKLPMPPSETIHSSIPEIGYEYHTLASFSFRKRTRKRCQPSFSSAIKIVLAYLEVASSITSSFIILAMGQLQNHEPRGTPDSGRFEVFEHPLYWTHFYVWRRNVFQDGRLSCLEVRLEGPETVLNEKWTSQKFTFLVSR